MDAAKIAVVLVGLALLAGGIYWAASAGSSAPQSSAPPENNTNLGGDTGNPISALINLAGRAIDAGVRVRQGDQALEGGRGGTRTSGEGQR